MSRSLSSIAFRADDGWIALAAGRATYMDVMGRRRVAVLALVLLLAAAAVAYGVWRWVLGRPALFGPASGPGHIVVSGNIEAHESVLSFTQVQAPIVYLPFDEGANVAAGTVLARVDDRLYRQQTEIDRTNLDVATAQVAANESNLVAAETSVTSDRFDLAQKQRDYARAEALVTGAISRQSRDLAYTVAQQSAAALARDQALVKVADNNVALAKANEAAAAAKLKLDEVMLSYTALGAPFSGTIAVREAELGQLGGPGVAVFTLDDLDHVWLRAYVNEPDLGKVRLGEPADVTTDTYPHHVYRGRISFISPQAEFTPKTVETHAERVTLVYRIRIDIDNPTHELLPGMPADATIALLAAGR
ncbi:MAG: efflux RND transporter periplasmic adaptor subunit [Magnetospirillum sp.]|nr:efflux RND transporter periplasmic adaptor subunit [Magnetospirillum sp.]